MVSTLAEDAKRKIGDSFSTDFNLKMETMDNAKTYDEKISLKKSIHKVFENNL